ncbi:MAG: Hsp20/alpha crystallin family protein [Christensenellales bacterium]
MSSLIPYNSMRGFFDDDFFAMPNAVSSFCSDIRETETAYILECELPGVERKDVSIDVDNGYLTITAHSREEKEQQERNYLRRERVVGSMRRTFNVSNTRTDEITAKLSDGILVINMPKMETGQHRNTRIDIQ